MLLRGTDHPPNYVPGPADVSQTVAKTAGSIRRWLGFRGPHRPPLTPFGALPRIMLENYHFTIILGSLVTLDAESDNWSDRLG